MNDLTSRQRKLVYAGGILMLLIPIVYLGAPTSEDVVPGVQADVPGGKLAQMRVKYDLGESKLGEIDPSSAAMSLVLLGLRGPAASVLHLKALDFQEKKNWAKLKTTVDSIIKLQPHYVEIWKFQGWNLAFNVSREWDRGADRFYWVKEGIKFLQLGTTRNQTATNLFHNVGDFMGRKFGNSDEKKFFRQWFLDDPDDERFPNGTADPEINPDGIDNYLVAYDWFTKTNAKDLLYRIKKMTHVIARQGPARALYDYATARQNEGFFGEENRAAWSNAYDEWTDKYGNDIFLGLNDVKYKLNCSQEELVALAEENGVTLEQQAKVWEQNVKMVNYRFWQNLADCERDEETVAAHKAIYDGKVAYSLAETSDSQDAEGNLQPSKAEQLFTKGIELMEQLMEKYPQLADHDAYIEEALLAVYYLQKIHQYNGREFPSEFPLKSLATREAGRMFEVERQFLIENRRGFK
ncbi:MAG: hypothetical protein R3C59_26775 [Planctomycetaceae bacterium]